MYYASVSQQSHHISRVIGVTRNGEVMATPSYVQLRIEVHTKIKMYKMCSREMQ